MEKHNRPLQPCLDHLGDSFFGRHVEIEFEKDDLAYVWPSKRCTGKFSEMRHERAIRSCQPS